MIVDSATLFLFVWCFLHSNSDNVVVETRELKMVHLTYRHGARAPVAFFPKDPYNESYWKNGKAQLTQIGMRMEYDLGKFIKKRYISDFKFIDRPYIHTQVYIRSSGVNRCLQSAECQLAGLYPPEGFQIWNTRIPWQPVPVHSVPKSDDPLLRPHVSCPRLDTIREENDVSRAQLALFAKNKELIDKVIEYTGRKDVDLTNFWEITDALVAEKAENLTLPKWALDNWDPMLKLADQVFVDRYRGNDELGILTGGPLLAKIVEDMKKWSKNEFDKLFKMNIYSGHDVSLLALTCALDVEIPVPIFASCIMIELYHSDELGYFVEMQFRNDYSGKLLPLKLKKCNLSCPLDKFIELTKNRLSKDRKKECHIEDRNTVSELGNTKTLLIVFIVLSIIFLIVIIILCYINRETIFKRGTTKHVDNYLTDEELSFEVYTDNGKFTGPRNSWHV